MKKEDCRKGLLVAFGEENCRGVIIKVNPRKAKVSTLDSHRGRRPGVVWGVPYSMLSPVVGDETGQEMMMRSFASPDDAAVKMWAGERHCADVPSRLEEEDYHILAAVYILYTKIADLQGRQRARASEKIHLLFRSIGREVSKESVERWVAERSVR